MLEKSVKLNFYLTLRKFSFVVKACVLGGHSLDSRKPKVKEISITLAFDSHLPRAILYKLYLLCNQMSLYSRKYWGILKTLSELLPIAWPSKANNASLKFYFLRGWLHVVNSHVKQRKTKHKQAAKNSGTFRAINQLFFSLPTVRHPENKTR